jgi:hypothetical protein
VIDAQAKAPVPKDSSGLIKEIMVTLDGRFVDDQALLVSGLTVEILRARAGARRRGFVCGLGRSSC